MLVGREGDMEGRSWRRWRMERWEGGVGGARGRPRSSIGPQLCHLCDYR